MEKAKRLKTEKTIVDSIKNVNQVSLMFIADQISIYFETSY